MKLLSRDEKIVLVVSVFLIALLTGCGIFYSRVHVKTEYHSMLPSENEVLKELNMKTDIRLEVKQEIPNDKGYYLDAAESVLNEVTLDFSGVDNQKLGRYEIKGKYKNQNFVIPVEVADTTAPIITAEHNDYIFYIEATDTVQTVLDYTNISVSDNYDEGLSVEEWITELPSSEGTVTYTVKAKDSSGNEASFDVVIHYVIIANNPPADQGGETNVEPEPEQNPEPVPTPEA